MSAYVRQRRGDSNKASVRGGRIVHILSMSAVWYLDLTSELAALPAWVLVDGTWKLHYYPAQKLRT